MTNITFGEYLRAIRESRMLSQKELAAKANIDPSHLNKIEKGIRMPSDDVLFRLADVLVADELFQAAGRVIPPEFEEKYPPFKSNPVMQKLNEIIQKNNEIKESLPNNLKKMLAIYQNRYDTIVKKRIKAENIIRTMESVVTYNDACISFHDLVGKMWEFELVKWEEGLSAGNIEAIIEIWGEINKVIKEDMVTFIAEIFKIDKDDAELVAAILKVIRERKKPSTDD
ncbi:Helix-turn-helix [Desulfotomaculum arcticum]|uniref:Helix-turn-helix n=1 Tax=Desulfotruncus arcticus DSM 17038 TaxID=1121424 RepID=A0A1I2N1C3_9FIRM|nr:helix-turn-helix transcriptional regulator [Desulfotruncus arcticus]SFF97674.1 Helix-turn-helix [Desulfotomaculum arcticum] [Desulfotruncus arcticus DSM 17038]